MAMFLVVSPVFLSFFGCSAPKFDGSNPAGKKAIIDATNLALSKEDCSGAINSIEDLYSSSGTDNLVRLIRASAQGCRAGLSNFLQFTGKLANTTDNPMLSTPGEGAFFWRTMAKLFYLETTSAGSAVVDSSGLNLRLDGAWKATDALLASLKVPKSAIVITNQINAGSDNVGSLDPNDRSTDANLYLIYVAMANVGILEDLYGYTAASPPDQTTFKKKQKLGVTATKPTGWETAANVDKFACSYVASILNLKDAIGDVSKNLPDGGLKKVLTIVSTILNNFDTICAATCLANGFTCTSCPQGMRSRDSCADVAGTDDDLARLAGAAIVTFIDTETTFGWVGP